jgi:hypothetical protein
MKSNYFIPRLQAGGWMWLIVTRPDQVVSILEAT